MTHDRLNATTVSRLPGSVQRPGYDREAIGAGQVHIGVGAFHRAHQAVHTDAAMAAAGGDWGVIGLSLRSSSAEAQLAPQDGLYTVATLSGNNADYRLIGCLKRIITAPQHPADALAALVSPATKVVTLTITEKGYSLDPATGTLLTEDPDIAADIKTPHAPKSAIGYVVAALKARRDASAMPFTAISCDNLPSNGSRLKSAVLQFAEATDRDLAAWIEAHGAFPETMVDRIVPATTGADYQRAAAALGLDDQGHVKTEPFMQWVIENTFCNDRPAWNRAGAMLVPDVAPYETAKLRLLNGPHSAIAYLGFLSGLEFVHDVMADAKLSAFIASLMDEEILPTLNEPAGLSLPDYAKDLRARFLNSALQHRTAQIAMDGSQKLPQRLLNTIRDRMRQGLPYQRLALAVAAWIVYASGRTPSGETIDVRDPLAARMRKIGAEAGGDREKLLSGFLALSEVFGDDLRGVSQFSSALSEALAAILTKGPRAAAGGVA